MAQLYLFPGGGGTPARAQPTSIALRQRVLEDILAPVPGESVANEEAHAFRALGLVLDRLIELAGSDITSECLRALARSRNIPLEG